MSAVKINCDQHQPLHELYGQNQCCLCKEGEKVRKLERRIKALERAIQATVAVVKNV